MLRSSLLCLALVLVGWTRRPQGTAPPTEIPGVRAVGEAYLEAYARADFVALAPWLDDQSTFHDETSSELGIPELEFHGKERILSGLTTAVQGLEEFALHYEEHFVSGPCLVAVGRLRYGILGESLGAGCRDVAFDLRVVTVLRVEEGKVREHRDYTDLSGWKDAVAAACR